MLNFIVSTETFIFSDLTHWLIDSWLMTHDSWLIDSFDSLILYTRFPFIENRLRRSWFLTNSFSISALETAIILRLIRTVHAIGLAVATFRNINAFYSITSQLAFRAFCCWGIILQSEIFSSIFTSLFSESY